MKGTCTEVSSGSLPSGSGGSGLSPIQFICGRGPLGYFGASFAIGFGRTTPSLLVAIALASEPLGFGELSPWLFVLSSFILGFLFPSTLDLMH